MIPLPSGVRVWLATGRTDMRKGMNGLVLQVQEVLKRDPYGGHLFVFRGRRGDRVTLCIPPFKTRAVSASLSLVDQRSSWVAARRFLARLS